MVPERLAWRSIKLPRESLPFYVMLVLLTYYRVQNASLSSWWLLPMIAVFHVGPKWEAGLIDVYPAGLICLLPMVLGWLVREDLAGDDVGVETQIT